MKSRETIEEVIINAKRRRSIRCIKLYRQLKMIYRELEHNPEQEDPKDLPEKIYSLVLEAF